MQRQNPDNNKGVTGKDVVVTGGTSLGTAAVGAVVVVGIGGLLAESSGIGAAIGATGGPIGIGIGATVGLLIGIIIGVVMRKKARQAERERDQAIRERDAAREDGARTHAELAERNRIVQMLEAENSYLQLNIGKMCEDMKRQSEKEKRRKDRFTAALIKLGIPSDELQSSEEEPEEEKKAETTMSQSELRVFQAMQECLQDCISLETMDDPVMGDDGKLHDRAQLQMWYDTQQSQQILPVYPETRRPLRNPAELPSSELAKRLLGYLSNYSHYPEAQAVITQNAANIADDPQLREILPSASVVASTSNNSSSPPTQNTTRRVSQMTSRPSPSHRPQLLPVEEKKVPSLSRNRRSMLFSRNPGNSVPHHREENAPLLDESNNSRSSFSNNSAQNRNTVPAFSSSSRSNSPSRLFTQTTTSSSSTVSTNNDNSGSLLPTGVGDRTNAPGVG